MSSFWQREKHKILYALIVAVLFALLLAIIWKQYGEIKTLEEKVQDCDNSN